MNNEKIQYWLDIADYDMETAKAMFSTGRWLYVGFMCHQVIEKTMKAYWCSKKHDEVPYIHNPIKLAQSTGLMSQFSEEQVDFLTSIVPLNIEARYPDYKAKIGSGLNKSSCKYLIDQTICLQNWIKERL